jgi:hypothetical protein
MKLLVDLPFPFQRKTTDTTCLSSNDMDKYRLLEFPMISIEIGL